MADGLQDGIALLGPTTTEEELAAVVEEIRQAERGDRPLIELLREEHPVYAGRGENTSIRMRGYVLRAFEQVGLSSAGLPFVLSELESSRSPYLVAAAARSLRGLGEPDPRLLPFLLKAVGNVMYGDDTVDLGGYWSTSPPTDPTTAMDELVGALVWMGELAAPARDALAELAGAPGALSTSAETKLALLLDRLAETGGCCGGHQEAPSPPIVAWQRPAEREPVPCGIVLEDSEGRTVAFDQLVHGHPTVVTFFYTRCTNPNKCSLTITKLAELQRLLRTRATARPVHTLALTYDPAFDLPVRLHRYGRDRGAAIDDAHRIARVTGGAAEAGRFFRLGVNFGPAAVNQHRIELYLLDSLGRIDRMHTRLQWDPSEVAELAWDLADRPVAAQPAVGSVTWPRKSVAPERWS